MISLREIAKKCGVSVITVSRALDPHKTVKVNPETRKKILEICTRENFYPSFTARSLASGKTRSIGFIVPGMSMISKSPQTTIYLEEMNYRLEQAGYNLVLLPVNGSDWETIRRNAEQLILSNRCDGYVTVGFSVELPAELPVAVLQTTSSEEIEQKRFPVICIDNRSAMSEMAEHLKKQGYGKPLFISFGAGVPERRRQWQEAFQKSAFPPITELDLPPSRIGMSGDVAMLKVLKARLPEIKNYDIWIFSNDQWALLAAELLESEGLAPGRDVALIGFDDIEKDLQDAKISTIAPPREDFGRQIARTVLERIKKRGRDFSDIRIELKSKAIFRSSSSKNISSTNIKEK